MIAGIIAAIFVCFGLFAIAAAVVVSWRSSTAVDRRRPPPVAAPPIFNQTVTPTAVRPQSTTLDPAYNDGDDEGC